MVVVSAAADAATLAPLAAEVATAGRFRAVVVATGMNPILVHEALEELGSPPDVTLLLDRPAVSAADEAGLLLTRLDRLVEELRPGAVLVRGGTLAALAATQAAFWRGIPVIHLDESDSPDLAAFPEPTTRTMVSRLAVVHLLSAHARAVESALARVCPSAFEDAFEEVLSRPLPVGISAAIA